MNKISQLTSVLLKAEQGEFEDFKVTLMNKKNHNTRSLISTKIYKIIPIQINDN